MEGEMEGGVQTVEQVLCILPRHGTDDVILDAMYSTILPSSSCLSTVILTYAELIACVHTGKTMGRLGAD